MNQDSTNRDASRSPREAAGWGARLSRHWLLIVNAGYGLFIGLTAVAPLLLMLGLEGPAWLLYRAYALNCHQLPQRSYFLFGPRGIDTYSLEQVLAWGANPNNLRSFVGNAEIGFKMAMTHRTVTILTAIFLGGLAYALFRRRAKGLSWKWYLVLMAPMFLDGTSHTISELTGLGFRQANTWAAWLTGALAGPASVWLLYPRIDEAVSERIFSAPVRRDAFEGWRRHHLTIGVKGSCRRRPRAGGHWLAATIWR